MNKQQIHNGSIVLPERNNSNEKRRFYRMVKVITSVAEFKAVVNEDRLTVVDFFAEWCGPCKRIAPALEKLSHKHAEKVTIVKVDVDNEELEQICVEYKITAMPTFKFIKSGKVVATITGANEKKIEHIIIEQK